MPIYSYQCKKCGNNFEILVGVTAGEKEKKCPQCGSTKIEKTFGSFSVRMGQSSSGSSPSSCSTGGCCPTC